MAATAQSDPEHWTGYFDEDAPRLRVMPYGDEYLTKWDAETRREHGRTPWKLYKRPTTARTFRVHCVYLLDCEDYSGNRVLKIGHTRQLATRIEQIGEPSGNVIGNPLEIRCCAAFYCWNGEHALYMERVTQYWFRALRYPSASIEWFRHDKAMVADFVAGALDLRKRFLVRYHSDSQRVAGLDFTPPMPACTDGVRITWR
jgi:hypothetical protein